PPPVAPTPFARPSYWQVPGVRQPQTAITQVPPAAAFSSGRIEPAAPPAWAPTAPIEPAAGPPWSYASDAPAAPSRTGSWLGELGVTMPDLSSSLSEIEARLEGRVLAWLGGIALVLGAIFFLSLAFTRGWIGPELRVLVGLGAGAGFMAAGAGFLS